MRGQKEFSREQKLIHENQRLKKQIGVLRKQLARIDLDRYSQVREIIEEHYQEDRAEEGQNIMERLKKEWACHEGGCTGYLEIILYNKINATWYYRKCSSCPHRTKSQKYDDSVKGIKKSGD
jgi:hypothetical protein